MRKESKFNVVLIVSDTLRRDHLGCYGNKWISTPNLDKFAERATVFEKAYCASFPTVPNRADLLTGRFTFTYFDWNPLPQKDASISEILSDSGYTTMMIADTPHILNKGYNFQRGFSGWLQVRGQEDDRYITDNVDVKLPCAAHKLREPDTTVRQYLKNVYYRRQEEDYFAARTMGEAVRWLERNYKHDNFFLYLDTFDPHEPWDPPRWYVDLYDPGYSGEEVIYPAYGPSDYLTEAELKHCRALYAGEVSLVDRWVGKVLSKITDLGLAENTVVIFTTDHGFYLGEHGLIGKSIIADKYFAWTPLYEEIAHIPLAIRVPGIKGGTRCRGIVQTPDIMPTILDLAGVAVPPFVQGKSLVPLLEGKAGSPRNFAVSTPSLIYGPGAGRRVTITTDEYALLYAGREEKRRAEMEVKVVDGRQRKLREIGNSGSELELYHLPSDPNNTRDVYHNNEATAEKLRLKFLEFITRLGASEEIVQKWT